MASFDRFIFLANLTNNNSQLLSGSGSDDILHDDLVLALDAIGGAQERPGVVDEAVEEDLLAVGDLCGVAVQLGLPRRRLDQVVLELGNVQSRSLSICAMYINWF